MFFSLGTQFRSFHFATKAFISTIFVWIKACPLNGTNLDSHDNLFSFCDWALKHVLFIGIHGFDALVLQEKLFFPPFSLESKFIHQVRQTWILIIISTLMVIVHALNIFLSKGCTVLMLWIARNALISIILLRINVHPSNGINLDSLENLQSFCDCAQ